MNGNHSALSRCSERERICHCGRRAGKEIRWDGNNAERRSGSFQGSLHGKGLSQLWITNLIF